MLQAPAKKKRYLSAWKVDSYLKDKFLSKPARLTDGLGCCSSGTAARWAETATRFVNFTRFCCVCSVSILQVLTPWALCVSEILSVVLIYALACLPAQAHSEQDSTPSVTPAAPPPRHGYHFSYWHSMEDVVGLSCTRAALLSAAYALGMHHMHRPYLYASYLLAALCFPYLVVKMILFRYGSDAIPAAAIFIITSAFCWLHVFTAKRSVDWARRRYQLGLGVGYPWDEESVCHTEGTGWGLLRRSDVEEGCEGGGGRSEEDVPAEMLADDDSKFLQVGSIKVHYKEVVPSGLPGAADGSSCHQTGIVLVHGFGAGAFAWRHVLEPLAIQCQCRVLAFDRPAFGLTSRPVRCQGQPNPYALGPQAHLLLSLCQSLGLTRVVLVGHADGCLLALRAASMALRSQQLPVSWQGSGQGNSPCSSSNAESPRTSKPGGPGSDTQLPNGTYNPPAGPGSDTAAAAAAAVLSSASTSGSRADAAVTVAIAGISDGGASNGGAAAASLAEPPLPRVRQRPRSSADTVMAAAAAVAAAADELAGSGDGVHGTVFARNSRGAPSPSLPAVDESNAATMLTIDTVDSWPISTNGGLDGVEHRSSVPTIQLDQGLGQGESGAGLASSQSVQQGMQGSKKAGVVERIPKPQRMEGARHRRVQSTPGPVDGRGSGLILGPQMFPGQIVSPVNSEATQGTDTPTQGSQGPWPQVLGIALLHPNLAGTQGPALSRLLASSKLGRSILKPLLRTEIGEVSNRRAWHNTSKLTAEVLDLYKAPLRVQGWCESLMETTRLSRDQSQGDLPTYLFDVRPLPTLILTGEHDRLVPPVKAEGLSGDLPNSCLAVVLGCGHLSHEEAPSALLEQLVPFCGSVLTAPPGKIEADR